MKELEVDLDQSQWANIEATFRKRAKRHNWSAFSDMLIIIFTLSICIGIFAGTDKFANWLFKTSAERQADIELANAKAEVFRSIATLGIPVSEFIRSLPPKIKPFLEKELSEYLKLPKDSVLLESPKLPNNLTTTPNNSTEPYDTPIIQRTEPYDTPIIQRTEPYDTPIIREERVFLNKPSDVSARNEGFVKKTPTLTNTEQVAKLYDTLFMLSEKYTELHLSLELEREGRYDLIDKEYIEQARNDTQIEISQIRSDAVREIAESKAYAEVDIAESKAYADREIAESKANAEVDIAKEETSRAEQLNVLISGALARIGSVVMVILLTRIFVKKRQRSVKVAAFYLGVADALAMSRKQSPDEFKDILPHLLPPDIEEDDGPETPTEQLVKIIHAAKHSG